MLRSGLCRPCSGSGAAGHDADVVQGLTVTFATIALVVLVAVVLRRRGYAFGGETAVRCRDGHVFTTVWVPLVSFKAIRLGWFRVQYCPVGEHLTVVTPVSPEDLTWEERRMAAMFHDSRVP